MKFSALVVIPLAALATAEIHAVRKPARDAAGLLHRDVGLLPRSEEPTNTAKNTARNTAAADASRPTGARVTATEGGRPTSNPTSGGGGAARATGTEAPRATATRNAAHGLGACEGSVVAVGAAALGALWVL